MIGGDAAGTITSRSSWTLQRAAGYDAYIAPEKTADSFSQYQLAFAFLKCRMN